MAKCWLKSRKAIMRGFSLLELLQLAMDVGNELEHISRQRQPSENFDAVFASYRALKELVTQTAEIPLSLSWNAYQKLLIAVDGAAGDQRIGIHAVANEIQTPLLVWTSPCAADFLRQSNELREGARRVVTISPVELSLSVSPPPQKSIYTFASNEIKLYLTGDEFFRLRIALDRFLIPKYRGMKIIE